MQNRNYKYGKGRMCKIPVSIVKSAAYTYPVLGLFQFEGTFKHGKAQFGKTWVKKKERKKNAVNN